MEDQLTAHLDRGWDLAHKGDAAGATACAKRALELDPKSPEVHNLMGYAAALDGDAETALEHYREAITLDESYFEAMMNAAEVLVAPLADWDGALAQIDEALDYAETDDEVADCVLLRVDAYLARGNRDQARRALLLLPDAALEAPIYAFLVGRAWFEIGEVNRAAPLIEQACKAEPESADAHYYRGLVCDQRGEIAAATEAWLRARALDLSQSPPAWAPTAEAFATSVRLAIEKLDSALSRFVREAEVYVVDMPGAELVVDGVDPRAPLVLDTRPVEPGAPGRVRIFVYKRNIERAAGSLGRVDDELGATLEHEVTHVFLEGHQPDKAQLN